jgi:hypothetical protein
MTHRIVNLRDAITRLHGCESKHLGSVPVKETFQGAKVWDGVVEVFSLTGHPQAKFCHAWIIQEDGGGERYVAVLEVPPVDSPATAVRAAIASDHKSKGGRK